VKQLVNIIGGSMGLLLSLPIIAIFGAIVYAELPSLVFYCQRRLGRDGKSFDIVKIRNIRLDPAKDGQIEWSISNHSRRLKMDAFVGKWNVDEAPQFWDVLKSKMGLVGPRLGHPQRSATFDHSIPPSDGRHRGQACRYSSVSEYLRFINAAKALHERLLAAERTSGFGV
jgi:lipopolysaccharide/colanic/teichoic acid biosynthesis glycosyltransferase